MADKPKEKHLTITYDNEIVRDHRVHGVRIMPGVTFLDIILRFFKALGRDPTGIELRDVLFKEPIAVSGQSWRRLTIGWRMAVTKAVAL